MQYAIDTISIEIGRLQKVVRKMKSRQPAEGFEDVTQDRIAEFEGQIRELKKAIGALKEYARNSNQQYQSQYLNGTPRQ